MFVIDTTKKQLEVEIYDAETQAKDCEFFGVSSALQLDDANFRVFKTERAADAFLDKYNRIKNDLKNSVTCKDRALPALLYKRRFIIQTVMGLKPSTTRHYKKDWQAGQLFNLHDQTHFLTVKLKKITEISKTEFKYDFELVK